MAWLAVEYGIGKVKTNMLTHYTYNCTRKGKDEKIALKELLFGFQEFGPEVLNEFLVEIKLMRYVLGSVNPS